MDLENAGKQLQRTEPQNENIVHLLFVKRL